MRFSYAVVNVTLLAALFLSIISLVSSASKATDKVPYPDVFVIGAQKCGTTSLIRLLYEHPAICSFGIKEKHFYSDEVTDASYKSYLDEFSGCKKGQMTFDATPSYSFVEETPQRLKAAYSPASLAKKKFILLLREPTARQYSEYQRILRICFRFYENDEKYFTRDSAKRTGEDKFDRSANNCRNVLYYNFVPKRENFNNQVTSIISLCRY